MGRWGARGQEPEPIDNRLQPLAGWMVNDGRHERAGGAGVYRVPRAGRDESDTPRRPRGKLCGFRVEVVAIASGFLTPRATGWCRGPNRTISAGASNRSRPARRIRTRPDLARLGLLPGSTARSRSINSPTAAWARTRSCDGCGRARCIASTAASTPSAIRPTRSTRTSWPPCSPGVSTPASPIGRRARSRGSCGGTGAGST